MKAVSCNSGLNGRHRLRCCLRLIRKQHAGISGLLPGGVWRTATVCGRNNADGHQIKTFWEGDETVCPFSSKA